MNNSEVYFNSDCLSSLSSNPNPPSQATIDAMNELWLMTFGLEKSGGAPNTSLNLTMLAQAISQLVAANPPYAYNDPTTNIFLALTGGSNPPAAGSPAALAAAYLSNPTDPNAEAAFGGIMQSLENSGFSNQVNSWWGQEGFSNSHVTINKNEGLPQQGVENLLTAIQAYMKNPNAANLNAIMIDIPYINNFLSAGNLDPYSQMLSNLLNTPLDPNDPNSSLAALAKSGDSNELGYYLLQGGFGSVLANQINTIISKEWKNG